MTPQQEARLLRARARTLRAQASYLWVREPLLDKVCCEEADACDAVAAELEAQAERETKVCGDAACAACGHAFRNHLPHAPGQLGSCIAGVLREGPEGQRCGCPVFTPFEAKESLPREPRDAKDANHCHDFSTYGVRTESCYGDGHYRCKECIHFGARKAICCGKPLGPGETCGDCTNQKEE